MPIAATMMPITVIAVTDRSNIARYAPLRCTRCLLADRLASDASAQHLGGCSTGASFGEHPSGDPVDGNEPVHDAGVRRHVTAADRRPARLHQGCAVLPLPSQGAPGHRADPAVA